MARELESGAGAWLHAQAIVRVRAVVILMALVAVTYAIAVELRHQVLLALGVWIAFACFLYAANELSKATVPWLAGDRAETAARTELDELRRDDYVVLHDLWYGGEGNLDHLVSGSNGVFLVETKAGGYTEEQRRKVKRLAARVHDELGCWVTPVLCSRPSRARTFVHDGVLVAGRAQVRDAIRSHHGGAQADSERLARFAQLYGA